MPVWVSDALPPLYEERDIANADWLERLAGSERVRNAVPHHRCKAPSVIEAKEKHRLAINTLLIELSAIYWVGFRGFFGHWISDTIYWSIYRLFIIISCRLLLSLTRYTLTKRSRPIGAPSLR